MNHSGFDSIAITYDDNFSNTAVGKLQRQRVWNYLEKTLSQNSELNILELNSGTGEDAIWFAKKGHKIIATDNSSNMIEIIKNKVSKYDLGDRISVAELDLNNISDINFNKKFDLVFSNFGGLNCINSNQLSTFSINLKKNLNPEARFIAVIMPDFCLIESLYFIIKLKSQSIFRRKKSQQVLLDDSIIDTYYYSPKKFYSFFKDHFLVNKIISVGFSIPPSYLNNFFNKKNKLLKILNGIENTLGNNSLTANLSDHFLIDLTLRQ